MVAGGVAGNVADIALTKIGASKDVAQTGGLVTAVLAGAGAGALIGAPVGGVGAGPGAVVGALAGGLGYLLSK